MSHPEPASAFESDAFMRSVIRRIATGPELSKDVSREEARRAMRLVLDGRVDPVRAGVFLIALRMKRETDEENCGVLDAIGEVTHRVIAPVDEVLDVADPYDGFIRTLPASPFLPAVLAACGMPSVSHGVELMNPKHGITHRPVLRAAEQPVDPRIYLLLAREAGFSSALVVRGVEGGVVPSLRQPAKIFRYVEGGEDECVDVEPRAVGVDQPLRAAPLPSELAPPGTSEDEEQTVRLDTEVAARAAAAAGLAAFEGQPGPARDALVYAGALCLWHLGRFESVNAAAQAVREALDSRRAAARLAC